VAFRCDDFKCQKFEERNITKKTLKYDDNFVCARNIEEKRREKYELTLFYYY